MCAKKKSLDDREVQVADDKGSKSSSVGKRLLGKSARLREIIRRAVINGGQVTDDDCIDLYDTKFPTPEKYQ